MADRVTQNLESCLPALLELIRKNVLEPEEVRQAMLQRKAQEFNLLKENIQPFDYLSMIEFEYAHERLRRKRHLELALPPRQEDYVFQKRIGQLWSRCTFKYKYRVEFWLQYLAFCYTVHNKEKYQMVVTRALRYNPKALQLWLAAVYFQLETEGNPFKARRIFLKGLALNDHDPQFWLQFVKFQLRIIQGLSSRQLSGIRKAEEQRGDKLLFEGAKELAFTEAQQMTVQENTKSLLRIVLVMLQKIDILDVAGQLLIQLGKTKVVDLQLLKDRILTMFIASLSNAKEPRWEQAYLVDCAALGKADSSVLDNQACAIVDKLFCLCKSNQEKVQVLSSILPGKRTTGQFMRFINQHQLQFEKEVLKFTHGSTELPSQQTALAAKVIEKSSDVELLKYLLGVVVRHKDSLGPKVTGNIIDLVVKKDKKIVAALCEQLITLQDCEKSKQLFVIDTVSKCCLSPALMDSFFKNLDKARLSSPVAAAVLNHMLRKKYTFGAESAKYFLKKRVELNLDSKQVEQMLLKLGQVALDEETVLLAVQFLKATGQLLRAESMCSSIKTGVGKLKVQQLMKVK